MPSRRRLRPRQAGRSEVAVVLAGAIALVVGSAGLGLAVNHLSPRGIAPLPRPGERAVEGAEAPALPLPAGVGRVSADEALAALGEDGVLFIDARAPREFEEAHIPGAVSMPPRDFDDRFPEVVEALEAASTVIVYCDGEACSESVQVAERLVEYRFEGVAVMEVGWQGWTQTGGPTSMASSSPEQSPIRGAER